METFLFIIICLFICIIAILIHTNHVLVKITEDIRHGTDVLMATITREADRLTILHNHTANAVDVKLRDISLVCNDILLEVAQGDMLKDSFNLPEGMSYDSSSGFSIGTGKVQGDKLPPRFVSVDGKFEADSLEELVRMMGAAQGIDTSDNDELKKFFNNLVRDNEAMYDMDDDDDEEDKPWENK